MSILPKNRVLIDQICMCIPLASTVNAAMDLKQRDIYKKHIKLGYTDEKYQDAYHQRILKTKKWVLCTLLIPVLGQIIIGIYNLAKCCIPKPVNPSKSASASDDDIVNKKYTLKGIQKLEAKAKKGDPQAEFDLASIYMGRVPAELIITLDKPRGFSLYQSAANRNFAPAWYALSWCYEYGHGVEENAQKARSALLMASDLECPQAQLEMGMLYTDPSSRGDAVKQRKGFELIQSAIAKGEAFGNYDLARCYEIGIGTDQDIPKAIECYKLALDAKKDNAYWSAEIQGHIDALKGKAT